jgi:hypothetical protein
VLKGRDEPIQDENPPLANQQCLESDDDEVTSKTVSSKAGGRKRKAPSHAGVIHDVLFFCEIIFIVETKVTKNAVRTSNKKAARELCQSSEDCAKDCSNMSNGPPKDGIPKNMANKAEMELRCQFSGNCTNDCFDSCGVCKMSYCEIHLNSHKCGQQTAVTIRVTTTKTTGKIVKKGTRTKVIV